MNLVFDLGGVVFTWEPEAIIASVFSDPEVQAKVRSEIFRHQDWLELDRGALDPEEAIRRASDRTGLPPSEVYRLMRRVPEALIPIPGTLDLMCRLRARGHKLYCLSNMHEASIDCLEGKYSFWDIFDGIVISSRIRMIKPEPGIYRHLLERFGLAAGETIFIDDTEANLRSAERLGIRTVKFENAEQCECELRELGCK